MLDLEKRLMEEAQWDLATVERQPYYLLMEIYNARESDNLNQTETKQSMLSFIENGGIATC